VIFSKLYDEVIGVSYAIVMTLGPILMPMTAALIADFVAELPRCLPRNHGSKNNTAVPSRTTRQKYGGSYELMQLLPKPTFAA
jgi:hypothetical protein